MARCCWGAIIFGLKWGDMGNVLEKARAGLMGKAKTDAKVESEGDLNNNHGYLFVKH